jgi:hypothetical protein
MGKYKRNHDFTFNSWFRRAPTTSSVMLICSVTYRSSVIALVRIVFPTVSR